MCVRNCYCFGRQCVAKRKKKVPEVMVWFPPSDSDTDTSEDGSAGSMIIEEQYFAPDSSHILAAERAIEEMEEMAWRRSLIEKPRRSVFDR